MSKMRLWLERIGVGIIAFLSLSAPFVFGLVYYLGVTDGIDINAGDPLRESRIWMIYERNGPTGIGWLYTAPTDSPRPGVQCARSQLTVLNWGGGPLLDTSARYCRCYEPAAGNRLKESPVACRE
ncbi:MAG: hypothetical protein KatS3mg052_2240 [Candidatus Roseilinea sp.]|nr:MAG: hypothetical protein KatS3mg052_2240 [Candidatus Roseilinea sp.]